MDITIPIYFNKSHIKYNLFRKIIKKQCKLDKSYITYCLDKFTDGYIYLDNKYFLKAYSLFMYDSYWSSIDGLVTCCNENYKGSGRIVLQSIAQFIKIRKIRTWNINSLPRDKLVKYYENFGFKFVNIKYRNNGKKKFM